ncbi:MAG: hypothetical protein MSIBF_02025 [Candidatus Altiarchaeales archaeon IMC4]|nr:MAG: hypothetical protein MSIBF_02025 [Candidatus Altiarchaeales archaeon IMC4]
MKDALINEIAELLLGAGFSVSVCRNMHSSFDILAKKEGILLIKVLSNVEGFTERNSAELEQVADALSAVPLVVGQRMKHRDLMRGVIYSRYDTNVMSFETLTDVIEESLPVISSVRGDYCVSIDPKMMVRVRGRLHLSQTQLADELDVSKQSIYRYERTGTMSIEVARRLIEFLDDEGILVPKDVLSKKHAPCCQFADEMVGLKKMVLDELRGIGMGAVPTRAPFDIVAGNEKIILTVIGNDNKGILRRMEIVDGISEIMDTYEVCISERHPDIDIAVISPNELAQIKTYEEFIRRIIG